MAVTPWYVGATLPVLSITINNDSGPDNITGATLSMIIRNTGIAPPVDTNGTGTFTVVTSNPAVVTYQFSAADVTNAGTYQLIIEAVYSGTPSGRKICDPVPFVLTAV